MVGKFPTTFRLLCLGWPMVVGLMAGVAGRSGTAPILARTINLPTSKELMRAGAGVTADAEQPAHDRGCLP